MVLYYKSSEIILWQLFSLKKHLSIDPNSDEAVVNLSKAYFDEGRLPKAIEVAKKGLILKPKIFHY